RSAESAAGRGLDGAARGDRELRSGKRHVHAARLLAERGRAARQYSGNHGLAEGAAARPHRRRGRRLRAEDRRLSRLHGGHDRRMVTGRPVHWMSTRSEAFLSDGQARDTFSEVELALDERGKFLALRIRHLGNMGAYIGSVGANIQTMNFTRCLPGMYDI